MSQMGPIEGLMDFVAKNFQIHQRPMKLKMPDNIYANNATVERKMEIHCKQHGEIHSATTENIDAPEFAMIVGQHLDEMHPEILQIKFNARG